MSKIIENIRKEFLAEPLQVGQEVYVPYTFIKDKVTTEGKGKKMKQIIVKDVVNGKIKGTIWEFSSDEKVIIKLQEGSSVPFPLHKEFAYEYKNTIIVPLEKVCKSLYRIGIDPFTPSSSKSISFYATDISGLLFRFGYERQRMENIPEMDFDPVLKDKNGEYIPFQRELVWTLTQKKLLIDSIYNGIEIGKFLIRKMNISKVFSDWNKGKKDHVAFAQCVDGKQRIHAIWEFMNDGFVDSMGNLFSDLSPEAQGRFKNFNKLTLGEMGESTTDEDVRGAFLAINFTGVPMSQEHIDFVKNIKL